ncbi:hypothetical protein BH23ACT9_BH23ACT9_12690 [soil metagenome]
MLQIPSAGPASYDGQMIRVRWEVRGTLELKWKRNPSATAHLLVVPAVVSG